MRAWLLPSLLAAAALVSQRSIPAQSSAPRGVRLADIAWPQAAELLGPDTVVVIPIGAASVEHGPHLKLSNDAILADYLTRRVTDAASVVVAPPLSYHFYPAFGEYPGSTSLTLDTARAMTTEIALSLARYGPRRFYVLNTAVPVPSALEPAARALAARGILLGYTDAGSLLDRVSMRVRQEEGGGHADEVETSMMLYVDPASVDMRRAARDYAPVRGVLQLTRAPGTAGTFSASGIWGDATLATREKGSVIVEGLVSGILAEIEAMRRATPPPPRGELPGAPSPVTGPANRSAAGLRTCTPDDERMIRDMGDKFTLAWTNADAIRLSMMWSEEGDMVHPDGMTERGRQVIRANRAALFLLPGYRGSRHLLTLGNVRCLTPDIAVVDGKWELRGVSDATGKPLPAFDGLCSLVLKRTGEWLIEAYRYTQKPGAPPVPVLMKRPGFPG